MSLMKTIPVALGESRAMCWKGFCGFYERVLVGKIFRIDSRPIKHAIVDFRPG